MAIEDRHTGPEYHSATPLRALNTSFSHMLEARDRSEKHIIMQQALKLAHDQVALIKRGIRLQFTSADTQPGVLNHLEQAGDLKPAIIQLLTLVANAEEDTNRSTIEASVIEQMNIVCLLVLKETKKPEPSEKNIELTIKTLASAQLFLISRDIHLLCTSPQQKAEPQDRQEKRAPTIEQVQDPSKRRFLFGAAAAGSGLALLAIEKKLGWLSRGQQASPKAEAPLHPTPTTETTPEVKEDKIEELKRLVGETKYYRNQIGLPNLPEDFQQNTDELSWQKAQHERSQSYTHNVDSGNVIFTRYLEAFCEQCFGENEHDVCVGSYTDPQEPGKTAYDCGKHMLLIPDNMHDAYPLDECAKYYLHEVAGHGTDPEIVINQFQPDVYIRILHGKARMLTKVFDFPDLFFNHKDDTTLVDIFGFVQIYLDARFNDLFGQKRLELIENDAELTLFLSLVCEPDGAGSVRPAKNFDREKMGELVQLIAQGKIRLKGELSSLYLKVFSYYLHEQYAELIKYAVLYPDLINHDPDILEGATEIFSAIKGETVSLESLRKAILGIPAKL